MVTFGTNRGPIVPPEPPKTTIAPSIQRRQDPAPVIERIDDTPNPIIYKPLVPHQYRTKIYSYRPHPNLILGTPIDQKYTPSLAKYDIYRKKQAKSLGLDYRGPHVFERQDYENDYYKEQENLLRKNFNIKPQQEQQQTQQQSYSNNYQVRIVPEIGIIYSSGLRYYIPQIPAPTDGINSEENSIYDRNDWKYVSRNQ